MKKKDNQQWPSAVSETFKNKQKLYFCVLSINADQLTTFWLMIYFISCCSFLFIWCVQKSQKQAKIYQQLKLFSKQKNKK